MRHDFSFVADLWRSLPVTALLRAGVRSHRLQKQRRAGRRGGACPRFARPAGEDLKASDFELIDDGQKRPLTNVWSEPSPASVAILMDASGSMATKMARARETADALVAGLKPGADEVAHVCVRHGAEGSAAVLVDLHPRPTAVWNATKAYGATSLWDAIAETSQKISDRQRRRALVVITDGVDSASRIKPSDVSAIASSLDVPVYVLVITSRSTTPMSAGAAPIRDRWPTSQRGRAAIRLPFATRLSMLAATRQCSTELHHQYMIAFEPGTTRGWHALVLRARKPGLFVRARSGYMVK